jgi:hypothetical protein
MISDEGAEDANRERDEIPGLPRHLAALVGALKGQGFVKVAGPV